MFDTALVSKKLNPRHYYRMPWSLTDNGISWIEVTSKCNLTCKGCYRDPHKDGHKTLEEIDKELNVFKAKRKSDCMSIAGGDPLVHPQIVEIVRMIRKGGWKPILNTNGLALTTELLHQLKEAGVFGFTFHIDTTQSRKDSTGLQESDHNALREKFARMLAKEGGIACSFNQTVSAATINQIPSVVRWAKNWPEIVHTMVFILYREPSMASHFDFYANGKKIDMNRSYNNTEFCGGGPMKAQDVVDQIRKEMPEYEPSAYLNGTVDPDSMKWLIALRVAQGSKTFGFVGPNFMKGVQHFSHFFRNKWLSYASPAFLKLGKISMLLFALWDKGMREASVNFLKSLFTNPLRIIKPVYSQTFTIIQHIDFMEDGQMNMCDGCPDITVHNGKLYWSCRLEEIKEYGTWVHAVPKQDDQIASDGIFEKRLPEQDRPIALN